MAKKKKAVTTITQPNKYYKFLNRLRESGKTNMFGAGQYLQQAYGMSRAEASNTLSAWMDWVSRNPSNLGL